MILLPSSRRRTVAPAIEPISLSTAKNHLNVRHTQDDALITLWITAARYHAEKLRSERFITQTWELGYPSFPINPGYSSLSATAESIRILEKPVQSVDSIIYTDLAGTEQTFGTLSGSPLTVEEYFLIQSEDVSRVALRYNQLWPIAAKVDEAVKVTVTVGYGDTEDDVPELIRAGMLLLIGHFNENRETVVVGNQYQAIEIPLGIRDILAVPRAG